MLSYKWNESNQEMAANTIDCTLIKGVSKMGLQCIKMNFKFKKKMFIEDFRDLTFHRWFFIFCAVK